MDRWRGQSASLPPALAPQFTLRAAAAPARRRGDAFLPAGGSPPTSGPACGRPTLADRLVNHVLAALRAVHREHP
jgi:hypothetical protein